jgi:hypothetical protein
MYSDLAFSFIGYFWNEAALNGIRDLIMKHPSELKTHKLAIIEKLRERICDSDKAVREVLYNIFECVIFRSLKGVCAQFVCLSDTSSL